MNLYYFQTVKKFLTDWYVSSDYPIYNDTTFHSLGMKKGDIKDLIKLIEMEFGIELDDRDVNGLIDVNDLVQLIRWKIRGGDMS